MGYAIAGSKYRWPNGRIPYEIDPHLLSNTDAATEVRKAIEHWNDNTIIQLFRRENNEADYLYFTLDLVDCASHVGRQGKKQTILCALTSKNFDMGSVVHEIGHAVGLYHEHTRLDRDKHVIIEFENIKKDNHHNFEPPKYESGRLVPTIDFDKYDFLSIMHYPKDGFTIDPKKDTITCITSACPIDMGQRVGLSPTDIRTVEAIYSLDFESLGGLAWGGDIVMTALGGWLYVIQKNQLYKVNPNDGHWEELGPPDWEGTSAMTALGGWLYAIQKNKLYKVNPNDGHWEELGPPDWEGTSVMTALGDWLHIIQKNQHYKVNPNNGEWIPLPLNKPVWEGTSAMTGLGLWTPLGHWVIDPWLYAIQNSQLYKVNRINGEWIALGSQMWRNPPHAMTSIGRHLYIIDNGHLFKVSP